MKSECPNVRINWFHSPPFLTTIYLNKLGSVLQNLKHGWYHHVFMQRNAPVLGAAALLCAMRFLYHHSSGIYTCFRKKKWLVFDLLVNQNVSFIFWATMYVKAGSSPMHFYVEDGNSSMWALRWTSLCEYDEGEHFPTSSSCLPYWWSSNNLAP